MSAGLFQFGDRVAGDEDGAALGCQFDEAGEELAARQEVEPGGRLVEQEDLGIRRERKRQADAGVAALGKVAEFLRRVESEPLGPFAIAGQEPGTVERAGEPTDVVDRHPVVKARPFGHVADAMAQFGRAAPAIEPEDRRPPDVGWGEAGEDLHGGGLAGAVIAEKCIDGAARHAQVEPVEGRLPAIAHHHAFDHDHAVRHVHLPNTLQITAQKPLLHRRIHHPLLRPLAGQQLDDRLSRARGPCPHAISGPPPQCARSG